MTCNMYKLEECTHKASLVVNHCSQDVESILSDSDEEDLEVLDDPENR